MKVIKYRRSGWEGGEQSLLRQQQALETFAEHNGYEVVADLSDMGSTSRAHRPGLEEAVQRVKNGEAEAIIATSFDRLVRAPYMARHLMDQGVRLITPELDTGTEAGRMTVRVISAWDEAERERHGQRVKQGMAAAKARREAGQ